MTVSFWVGFANAKGLGQKKGLVKTLTFGADGTEDISGLIYPGRPGLLVTIRELEKVEFAVVNVLSSLVTTSGIVYGTVAAYSGNTFTVNFAAVLSGNVGADAGIFSPGTISGMDVSGVLNLQAFVIGEGRKGAN